MNGAPRDAGARGVAESLSATLMAVCDAMRGGDASVRRIAFHAATSVTELLALPGLAALIGVCRDHAQAPPLDVRHALERLERLAHALHVAGDLGPATLAEADHAALAATIAAQEWTAPTHREPVPQSLQSLADTLTGFEVDDPAQAARARLTLPVASGLRAALDWLAADLGGPLKLRVHDAALTLSVRAGHLPGLAPAGAVLSLTGGALLPEAEGRWALRVPLHAERPAFLLARQGELALALPWPAVARLRLADAPAAGVPEEPGLDPWSALTHAGPDHPAALLALGLTRAWVPLDRIVWRVFAEPRPAGGASPVPGGAFSVQGEDGVEYRVVDPGQALAAVPPVETPATQPREREAAPASVPVLDAAHARPLSRPEPARPTAPAPVAASIAPAAPTVRRALVVDDSLVTRMALARVLESQGWQVEFATHADAMWRELDDGRFAAVFADVSLPDASGLPHLRALVAHRRADERLALVALCRDEAELRLAAAAGIGHCLLKPFAPGRVEETVAALVERA